jgi:hypothetical protein
MLTAHSRIHYVPIDIGGIRCKSISCGEAGCQSGQFVIGGVRCALRSL